MERRWSLLTSPAGPCTGSFPGVVYVRVCTLPRPGCPNGRHACRVSRAVAPASARRPRAVPPLRAPPPREDAALQDRGGVPRGLARRSLGPRAARRGLCRRGVPRVSHVRAALLRIRPRPLHTVPAAVRRRLLVQATGRVPVLQRPAHGPDGRSRKSTQPGASGVIELAPVEFLDRLADLIPQPRRHRHMYHGVFAPNHPLRPAVTSLAVGNLGQLGDAASSPPLPPGEGRGEGAGGSDGVFRCDIRGTLTRPAATLSQRERGIASCAAHLPCSISLWQLLRVQCPFHFPSPIGALVRYPSRHGAVAHRSCKLLGISPSARCPSWRRTSGSMSSVSCAMAPSAMADTLILLE